MIPFLDKESRNQPTGQAPDRSARVEVVIENEKNGKNELFELLVDLDHDRVSAKQHLKGKHSYIDSEYMKQVEKACLANAEVQQKIRTLNLPDGATVVVEPWAYATDGLNDMTERVTMVKHHSCQYCPGAISDCFKVLVLSSLS